MFDLLTEVWEDFYEENPRAQLDMLRDENGEVVFSDTGDPLLDKWEQELAMGLEPDLSEGLSEEARKRLDKEREVAKKARKTAKELDGLVDEYDMKYQSKFASPGSVQERELLSTKKGRVPDEFDPTMLMGHRSR